MGDGTAIEARVVQNNEARHFHLFHVQNFMDHVLDTLPETLIAIDSIDDAAAKIGTRLARYWERSRQQD